MISKDSYTFIYRGKEYQIDKLADLYSETGKRDFEIITKDDKQFKLIYNESIFNWVVTESTD
jgi:hypothetical protein